MTPARKAEYKRVLVNAGIQFCVTAVAAAVSMFTVVQLTRADVARNREDIRDLRVEQRAVQLILTELKAGQARIEGTLRSTKR